MDNVAVSKIENMCTCVYKNYSSGKFQSKMYFDKRSLLYST